MGEGQKLVRKLKLVYEGAGSSLTLHMSKVNLNAKSETKSSLGEMSLPLVNNNEKHQSEAGAQGKGSKETAADGRVGNVSDTFG